MAERRPLITIVAALTHDRVIGAGEGMPWDLPEDYEQFLERVRGGVALMGRRSYEIFGPDLTTARSVVVSRSRDAVQGAEVRGSFEEALARARKFALPIFILGGAEIYGQGLTVADAMALSWVEGEFEGDVHFPAFEEADWRVTQRRQYPGFELVTYARRQD